MKTITRRRNGKLPARRHGEEKRLVEKSAEKIRKNFSRRGTVALLASGKCLIYRGLKTKKTGGQKYKPIHQGSKMKGDRAFPREVADENS